MDNAKGMEKAYEIADVLRELDKANKAVTDATELTNNLKRIVERQRETITKLTALNTANNAELQGTKVCLSILTQREGGKIIIPDHEMQDHSFKLEVSYDSATLSTVFKSHVSEVIKTPQ